MITITFPDKSSRQYEAGTTPLQIAESISPRLAQDILAATVNGEEWDISRPINDDAEIKLFKWDDPEGKHAFWHSSAHLLAEALQELYPGVKFGIGPAIENGFYYDIDPNGHTITAADFPKIEAKMIELAQKKEPIVRADIAKADAMKMFGDRNEEYKCELISELEDGHITTYTQGAFTDLCRGPHLPNTAPIKAVKITSLAGAYWRGDEKRNQLVRVYGITFPKKKMLDEYLVLMEEAKKRDHRILGPKLGLFELMDEVGPGLPLFLPNGARVVRTMQEWLRKQLYERGYQEVITPHVYKSDVWKTSGHYDFYKENMYFFNINEGTDEEPKLSEFGVKPMNCPGHVLLYKSRLHSYRDLPLRYFEFGTVYRHELSGAVHGLFRARGFTQDDAHVFCREDQVVDEVEAIMDLVDIIMGTFDLEYSAEISTRPAHSIGTDEMWEKAEAFLKEALERRGMAYDINEGDGAFYGPKIDIKVKDSIGRTWQCSTIQVDFNLPERFGITYRTADNTVERPWMLHRAIFGSIERFLGILIENYAGALPLWLAPVQAVVVPITDRHLEYAEDVAKRLRAVGGRVEVASQSEPMRAKIAKAQDQKIPYMLVVGDKEAEDDTVSVRERFEGDQGARPVEEFVKVLAAAQV